MSGFGRLAGDTPDDSFENDLALAQANPAMVSAGETLPSSSGATGAFQSGSGETHIYNFGPAPATGGNPAQNPSVWNQIAQGGAQGAVQALGSFFGIGQHAPAAPKSGGVLGFLTSTPVLVGGAVLVGLILLKKRRPPSA